MSGPNQRPPNNNAYVTNQMGQPSQNQNNAQKNPSIHMPSGQTGQYQQRPNQFPGGFNIPGPPAANVNPAHQIHQNPNPAININTQQPYNRASVLMSPTSYYVSPQLPQPSQPHQISQILPRPSPNYQNSTTYYQHMSQALMSPTDLMRKFYGTCHGCGNPNTDFAECHTCKQWLVDMESMVNARKALIQRQFCSLCKLPKHVHHQIAACGKCGFPKSNIEELSKTAVKKEQSDSIFEDHSLREKLGFVCTNCNQSLEGFLKCPTYGEVATRMRKERELVEFTDPNFHKLSNIVKDYAERERGLKPKVQNSTKPIKVSDDKVNELTAMTKNLRVDSNNISNVSDNQNAYASSGQGGYNPGTFSNPNNQSNHGRPYLKRN